MAKIFVIDSENVGDSWIQLLAAMSEDDKIYVFYTDKSPYISYESLLQVIAYGSIPRFVKCHEGRNALDFQLVSELGYMLAQMPSEEFVIVSDDNGFDAVVRYWSEKNFKIRRIGRKFCRSLNMGRREGQNVLKKDASLQETPVEEVVSEGMVEGNQEAEAVAVDSRTGTTIAIVVEGRPGTTAVPADAQPGMVAAADAPGELQAASVTPVQALQEEPLPVVYEVFQQKTPSKSPRSSRTGRRTPNRPARKDSAEAEKKEALQSAPEEPKAPVPESVSSAKPYDKGKKAESTSEKAVSGETVFESAAAGSGESEDLVPVSAVSDTASGSVVEVPEKATAENAVQQKAVAENVAQQKTVAENAVQQKAARKDAVQQKATGKNAVQQKAAAENAAPQLAPGEEVVPQDGETGSGEQGGQSDAEPKVSIPEDLSPIQRTIWEIVLKCKSLQPAEDAKCVYEMFFTVSMTSLTEVNSALKTLIGNEEGNDIYRELKEHHECRQALDELYLPTAKERFLRYVQIVLERSDLKDISSEELGKFLLRIPRKNLNSIRSSMQKEYGTELGSVIYTVYKPHIKVLNKIM